LLLAAEPLQPQQRDDEDEHDERNLRRTAQVAAPEPGRIDAKRQRAHAEVFNRADIIEALHHRKADTNSNRRPGKR
jgi:hypothetical protein